MLTIYKYPLHGPGELTNITIPADADLIHFDIQGDTFCIWAAVNTANIDVQRTYAIVGTGWDLSDLAKDYRIVFLKSVLSRGFVWHLLQLVKW
jgi:hypothetical protein